MVSLRPVFFINVVISSEAEADGWESGSGSFREQLGGVIAQLVIMIAFILVLSTFVYRLRTDKPCSKQVELFKWWPQALRPKSFKRGQTAKGRVDSGVVSPQSTNTAVTGDGLEKAQTPKTGKKSRKVKKTRFGSVQEGLEYTEKEIRGAKMLLVACILATFFIFIRSVFFPPFVFLTPVGRIV